MLRWRAHGLRCRAQYGTCWAHRGSKLRCRALSVGCRTHRCSLLSSEALGRWCCTQRSRAGRGRGGARGGGRRAAGGRAQRERGGERHPGLGGQRVADVLSEEHAHHRVQHRPRPAPAAPPPVAQHVTAQPKALIFVDILNFGCAFKIWGEARMVVTHVAGCPRLKGHTFLELYRRCAPLPVAQCRRCAPKTTSQGSFFRKSIY